MNSFSIRDWDARPGWAMVKIKVELPLRSLAELQALTQALTRSWEASMREAGIDEIQAAALYPATIDVDLSSIATGGQPTLTACWPLPESAATVTARETARRERLTRLQEAMLFSPDLPEGAARELRGGQP